MARFASCPHDCARLGVAPEPKVRWCVAMFRILRVVGVLVGAAFVAVSGAVRSRLLGSGPIAVDPTRVHRALVRALGIAVEITGDRDTLADPGEPVLVVANHTSWVDVIALSCIQRVRLVAKKEVGDLPVVGAVARASGTIFIDRENLRGVDAARRRVAADLRSGHVVTAFPEATTTCGRGLAMMFPAMFQAAIDVGVPVQPVTFVFTDGSGRVTTAGTYVGEQSLLASLLTIVRQRDLHLRIGLLPRIAVPHPRNGTGDKAHARKSLRTTTTLRVSRALDARIGDWRGYQRSVDCRAASSNDHVRAAVAAAVDLGRPRRQSRSYLQTESPLPSVRSSDRSSSMR